MRFNRLGKVAMVVAGTAGALFLTTMPASAHPVPGTANCTTIGIQTTCQIMLTEAVSFADRELDGYQAAEEALSGVLAQYGKIWDQFNVATENCSARSRSSNAYTVNVDEDDAARERFGEKGPYLAVAEIGVEAVCFTR